MQRFIAETFYFGNFSNRTHCSEVVLLLGGYQYSSDPYGITLSSSSITLAFFFYGSVRSLMADLVCEVNNFLCQLCNSCGSIVDVVLPLAADVNNGAYCVKKYKAQII